MPKKSKPKEPKPRSPKQELHLVEPGQEISYQRLNEIFSTHFDVYRDIRLIWTEELKEFLVGHSLRMIEVSSVPQYDPQIGNGDVGVIREVKLTEIGTGGSIMVWWDKGKLMGALPGTERFEILEPGDDF